MMFIIDRRPNPRGRSLPNTQRYDAHLKLLIQKSLAGDDVKILDDPRVEPTKTERGRARRIVLTGKNVSLIHEPRLRFNASGTGKRDHVYPRNKKYLEGDKPPRSAAPIIRPDPDFTLRPGHFFKLVGDELNIPADSRPMYDEQQDLHAQGHSAGTLGNMHIKRSLLNAMGRRIAAGRSIGPEKEKQLIAERQSLQRGSWPNERIPGQRIAEIDKMLIANDEKKKHVAYLEPGDIQRRHIETPPTPATRIVLFVFVDGSDQMTLDRYQIAADGVRMYRDMVRKRHPRQDVDLVRIRYSDRAEQVKDWRGMLTVQPGGPPVFSRALEEMQRVRREMYAGQEVTAYAFHAGSGKNSFGDAAKTERLMRDNVLTFVSHYAYLETQWNAIDTGPRESDSDLWATFFSSSWTNFRRGVAGSLQENVGVFMKHYGPERPKANAAVVAGLGR